jgi:hypothetical protein
MAMIFLVTCDGLMGCGGVTEGVGRGAVIDVPHCIQNFTPGGISLPHLEQNGITVTDLSPRRSSFISFD